MPFECLSAQVFECPSVQVPWVPECSSALRMPKCLECLGCPSALRVPSSQVPKCPSSVPSLEFESPSVPECLECLECQGASVNQLVIQQFSLLAYNAAFSKLISTLRYQRENQILGLKKFDLISNSSLIKLTSLK